MNGFQVMADSYRKAAEDGRISKEQAEKDCRIFDFLASCDQDDIYRLFDSSAFNEIAKSYMHSHNNPYISFAFSKSSSIIFIFFLFRNDSP